MATDEHDKRFLGIPYDWRKPTLARAKARMWNADDERVFTPKSFGFGWDVNLRAIPGKLRRKS